MEHSLKVGATMTKNLFLFILFIIIFSRANCQERLNQIDNKTFTDTDNYLEKIIESLEIVGLNYAVLVDGKVAHKKAFGLSNIEHQVPMTIDNLFAVASIAKLFSSIALHNLLNTNKRNVNETAKDFLPDREDLPGSWRKLTLKQLLSHTSGIPDQIDYQIYLAPESQKFVIEAMKDKPFSSKSGDESKYNATGFLIVQIIIEKLANQDFESYMQKQYFDKLHLDTANYGGFKKVVPKRVTSYTKVNNQLEMFPLNYSSPMYAGAGLNISINELILWFQAILNEQILSEKQLQEIWTPVKLNNGKNGYFGLGWEAYKLGDNYSMTGHGGAGISSFRHYWNEQTKNSITVIVLTNGARSWTISPNQINSEIANIILSSE